MKIRSVNINNRKRVFEVATWKDRYDFPYSKAEPAPSSETPIKRIWIDKEIGSEGFSYELSSSEQGTVHIDQVLEYNQDPAYLRNLLLYRLTVEASKRVEMSSLSKREIIRRLGTSAAQFYRLLDTTNYRKSLDKVLSLLQVLDCEVDFVVREKSEYRPSARPSAKRKS